MNTPPSPRVSELSRSCEICTSPLLRRGITTAVSFGLLTTLHLGCATHYRFGVEAINQTGESIAQRQHSFRLIDARPDATAGDPVFAQVARDVETALSSKGLFATPPGVTPEIVIEVDYGVSDPIATQHVRAEPIYLPGPRLSGLSDRGQPDPVNAHPVPTFFANKEATFTVTTYEKFLRLTAREARPADGATQPRQVWSVYVVNEDESADLSRYVRLMIAAAMDNVGQDFGNQRRVVLTRSDGRVEFVETGMDSS